MTFQMLECNKATLVFINSRQHLDLEECSMWVQVKIFAFLHSVIEEGQCVRRSRGYRRLGKGGRRGQQ